MKTVQKIVLGMSLLMTTASSLAVAAPVSPADQLKQTLTEIGPEKFTASDYKPGLIKHIVLFRYQDSVTQEQKNEVKKRFLALANQAKRDGERYIVSIVAGDENSGEGVDQGLEQGFIVTFKSQGDRNYYVGAPLIDTSTDDAKKLNKDFFDPAHQAFKDFVGPLLHQNPLGVVVFDFAVE